MLHMLAGEISTPFLYVFKSEIFPKDSPINLLCQILFAALFLAARMFIAPFLAKDLLSGPNSPLAVKTACGLLLLLSTYWAGLVVKEVVAFVRPDRLTGAKAPMLLDTTELRVTS
jgi:hypothetical protein